MAFNRKDAVIIQNACENSQPLLDLTLNIHREYCIRHDFDYWPIFGRFMPDNLGKEGVWEKTYLIRLALEAGYEKVIFLDCDCLIVTDEDLREACPPNAIGCTWHASKDGWKSADPEGKYNLYDHFNIGAMYISNCEDVRRFVEEWWNTNPGTHCWSGQHAFMLAGGNWGMSDDRGCLAKIDTRYNSTFPEQMSEQPAVMAWHGYGNLPTRYQAMKEAIALFYPNSGSLVSQMPPDLTASSAPEAWHKAQQFILAQDWQSAIVMLRQMIDNDVAEPYLWKTLADCFVRLRDHASAVPMFKQAIALNQRDPELWRQLSGCYSFLGEQEQSKFAIAQAMKWGKGSPAVHINNAFIQLREGNWEEGFADLEYDFLDSYKPANRKLRTLRPMWNFDPVDTLFVWAEQGFGDTIMFSKFLPCILNDGLARRVIFEVQPAMVPLLTNQFNGVEIMRQVDDRSLPFEFDAHCPIMSLPRVMGFLPAHVNAFLSEPHIKPLPHKAANWKARMGDRFKVGFVFGGNQQHANDYQRSMDPDLFLDMVSMDGIQFFCLQYGLQITPEAMAEVQASTPNVAYISHEINDFTDAAAIISNLDLLISVDTAYLHLAGSMGIPAFGLISKSSDWRWLTEDHEDTVWYPSVKLYRQKVLGDWEEVMLRIEHDLRKLTAPKNLSCPNCLQVNPVGRTHCIKCSESLLPTLKVVTV